MSDENPMAKLRLTLGPLQLEFEGSERFLKEELPALISTVVDLHGKVDILKVEEPVGDKGDGDPGKIEATTGTMAAKLQVKSGPDLIKAAASKLTFSDQKATFTRDEIITEMRSAPSYYKETYLNNLTKYLQGLVKGDIFYESKKNTYALSASAAKDLRKKVAS